LDDQTNDPAPHFRVLPSPCSVDPLSERDAQQRTLREG
jgi:hypothetical protein